MWNGCSPIHSDVLRKFEDTFNFHINEPLRDFLLTHNSGKTRHCSISTTVKERRLAAFLDFSRGSNAWEINRRMRKILGNKCIVIGTDRSDNFLCIRRTQRMQELVIWNHVSGELEEATTTIPLLLMEWKTAEKASTTRD